jgi:hypothetical protein
MKRSKLALIDEDVHLARLRTSRANEDGSENSKEKQERHMTLRVDFVGSASGKVRRTFSTDGHAELRPGSVRLIKRSGGLAAPAQKIEAGVVVTFRAENVLVVGLTEGSAGELYYEGRTVKLGADTLLLDGKIILSTTDPEGKKRFLLRGAAGAGVGLVMITERRAP